MPVVPLFMLLMFAIQVFIMMKQRSKGPRWFVPESWRRDPNAYNYIRDVPQALINKSKREAAEK
jgi:hypothetical protein